MFGKMFSERHSFARVHSGLVMFAAMAVCALDRQSRQARWLMGISYSAYKRLVGLLLELGHLMFRVVGRFGW